MPLVTMPDGAVVNMPDELSPELASRLRALQSSTKQTSQEENKLGMTFEDVYASVPYRIAKSFYDPIEGSAQLLNKGLAKVTSAGGLFNNPVSNWLEQSGNRIGYGIKQGEERVKEAYKTSKGEELGTDYARIAGGLINPITYAPIAGMAKVIPATNLASAIKQGAASGAMLSSMQPVSEGDFWAEKEKQAAAGAVIGGAIPAGAKVVKSIYDTGKNVVSVLTPNGYKTLSIDALKEHIGEAKLPAVAEGLIRANPIVQGSIPTASEALAGIPGGSPIAAFQKVAAEQAGGSSAKFGQRIIDQQVARAKALSFAGTDADLANAIQARTEATKPLYDAVTASTAKVKVSPVMSYLNDTITKNANRDAIANPLKKIREGLIVTTETGQKLETKPQNIKSLIDQVKDMMAAKTPDGQAQYDVKVLAEAKDLLEKQLGSSVKEYGQAQQVFKEMSVPVNQMQVGRYLQEKLINPTGTETPRAFINTLDDAAKMIKKSTGMSRFNKIEDVLTPENAAAAKSVALDLERSLSSKNPAQKTNIGSGNVSGDVAQFPQLLSRAVTIANAAIRLGKGNIEKKSHTYLADLYLNPKELGKLLAVTPPKDRSILVNAVHTYGKKMAEATPSLVIGQKIGSQQ